MIYGFLTRFVECPAGIEDILKKGIVSISLVAVLVIIVLMYGYEEKMVVAGTLRSSGNQGWYVISDKAHVPLNISRVEVKNGAICVYYAFTASRTHTFIVTPDETFAGAGIFVGASVSKNRAAISLSRVIDGKVVRIDPSKIESDWGNFWIYGLFTK